MADDRVVFVLHRAMTVSAPVTATKGAGRPDQPYVFKDATVPFEVREATEQEAQVEAQKLKDEVTARVRQLRLEAGRDG